MTLVVDGDWQRLAAYANRRVRVLGFDDPRHMISELNQQRDADNKISENHLQKIFWRNRPRPVGVKTLALVDEILEWQPGSSLDVLAGREPRLLREETSPARTVAAVAGAAEGTDLVSELMWLRRRSSNQRQFVETIFRLIGETPE